jgi:hypothetical protein
VGWVLLRADHSFCKAKVEILRYQHVGSTLLTQSPLYFTKPVQSSSRSHTLLHEDRYAFTSVRCCSNDNILGYDTVQDYYLVLTFRRNIIMGGSAYFSKRRNKPMIIFKVRHMYNLITLFVHFHRLTCFEPLTWVHLQGHII